MRDGSARRGRHAPRSRKSGGGSARRSAKRVGGFTLLEVLVALAILSAVLVLAYQVMAGAIAASERSERWTVTAFLGESILRDALATFPDVGEISGRFPPPDDAYTWVRVVKQAAHQDAREVHVTVIWTMKGAEERMTLSGIAAK